jgi:hypothetical protein
MKKLTLLLVTAFLFVQAAMVQAASSVTLAWDASPDVGVTNYNLYWGLMSGTNHATTNTVLTGNVTVYTLTNALTQPNTYWFYVTALGSGLESVPSNEIRYAPPYPSPDQMAGFRYTTFWQGRNPWVLQLDWFAVTNIPLANYRIYWGLMNTNNGTHTTTNILPVSASQTTCTVSNLITGNTYWFSGAAVSTDMVQGPYSDEIRYFVYPIAPRGPGSFRQVITVQPGQ